MFEVGLGLGLRCYLYLYGAVNVWWARGLVRIRRQLAELLVVGSNPTEPAFHSTGPAELLFPFPVQMVSVDLVDKLETELNQFNAFLERLCDLAHE